VKGKEEKSNVEIQVNKLAEVGKAKNFFT